MSMIQTEYHEEIALIKLSHGITNALNLELINGLSESLQKAVQDNVRSLVLTSSNEKFFSIGYDLRNLYSLSRGDFALFYKAFNQFCINLFTSPIPTVAAITGHAIAGGCALTLCCDYRFIAEGRKLMGFNVVRLGIPVPYTVTCILQNIVGYRTARDIADSGEFCSPENLLRMGMVDCVLPLEDVIPRSIEKAQSLGRLPQEAFAITKRNRIESIEAQILAHLKEKEELFVECWFSEEARKLLGEAMEKF